MPRILFVHRNGPGQFLHLARHLAGLGWEATLLCESADAVPPGVRLVTHRPVRGRAEEGASSADYQLRVGTEVADQMERIRRREGAPDVILGHGGWGSLLFARDIFPETPVAAYCEFFYRAEGADMGFDPSRPVDFQDLRRLKGRNFAQVTTLLGVDTAISPTNWQRSLYPLELRSRISVVHDGIDLAFCRPDDQATFALPGGRVLRAGDRVVTFAARDLEPYRGFPEFMRAAAALARRDPDVTFVVAGADGTSYGTPHESGRPWREVLMAQLRIDPSRIHFVGTLPHADLIRLFQVSAAHVYLTYPFVLSWSALEAMACGALLIGSATAPVTEFVEHRRNGLLVPFFDTDALAATLSAALARPEALKPLRAAARETVRRKAELSRCLAEQTEMLTTLANRSGSTKAAPSFAWQVHGLAGNEAERFRL